MIIHHSAELFWMRFSFLGFRGFYLSRHPLSFSERNGFARYLPLPFGWRFRLLETP